MGLKYFIMVFSKFIFTPPMNLYLINIKEIINLSLSIFQVEVIKMLSMCQKLKIFDNREIEKFVVFSKIF